MSEIVFVVIGCTLIGWGINWQTGLGMAIVIWGLYLGLHKLFLMTSRNLVKVNNNLASEKPVKGVI